MLSPSDSLRADCSGCYSCCWQAGGAAPQQCVSINLKAVQHTLTPAHWALSSPGSSPGGFYPPQAMRRNTRGHLLTDSEPPGANLGFRCPLAGLHFQNLIPAAGRTPSPAHASCTRGFTVSWTRSQRDAGRCRVGPWHTGGFLWWEVPSRWGCFPPSLPTHPPPLRLQALQSSKWKAWMCVSTSSPSLISHSGV